MFRAISTRYMWICFAWYWLWVWICRAPMNLYRPSCHPVINEVPGAQGSANPYNRRRFPKNKSHKYTKNKNSNLRKGTCEDHTGEISFHLLGKLPQGLLGPTRNVPLDVKVVTYPVSKILTLLERGYLCMYLWYLYLTAFVDQWCARRRRYPRHEILGHWKCQRWGGLLLSTVYLPIRA